MSWGESKTLCGQKAWGKLVPAKGLPVRPIQRRGLHNENASTNSQNSMIESLQTTVPEILIRLVTAGVLGGLIGFERRAHHKAIGIAGMILIAIGSTTFMLLAKQLSQSDPAAISRTLQGLLSGIGFFGGAVIFKSGYDVKGVKAAAAVWITGAIGLAIGTSLWWLGITVGMVTFLVMFVSDSFPDPEREAKTEEGGGRGGGGGAGFSKTK
jgi:putative Mg2+ transporter-C (MgtC) family protein